VIDDLEVFYDPDDFAITALLDGVEVVGIFDNEPVEDNFVNTTAPHFNYEFVTKPATLNSVLVIGATTYKVKVIAVDSGGSAKLKLEKQ